MANAPCTDTPSAAGPRPGGGASGAGHTVSSH